MTADRDLAYAFLRADPLRYLMPLKYLHLYPDGVACRYLERDGAAGVLLSYPPNLINWDQQAYPNAAVICLPVAAGETASVALALAAGALAAEQPFICKTCDPLTRAAFAQQFVLQPMRAFVSYTAPRVMDVPPDPEVVIAAVLDPRCAALAARTPYAPAELAHYLADGGLTFTLFEQDEAVCMCLIYRNVDDIWEIAALHTLEAARRRGYARRVVLAALAAIQARGGTPRYVIERSNTVSTRLAESLGLTAFLTVEHDRAQAR